MRSPSKASSSARLTTCRPNRPREELTSASDVYSLGLVLFELITGQRPFTGDTPLAVIAKQLHEPLPKIRRKVPLHLSRFLGPMTAKKPAARPTFDRVIAELEKIELWSVGGEQQVQWGQVMFVVLGVGGLFISSTLAIEFARTLGA